MSGLKRKRDSFEEIPYCEALEYEIQQHLADSAKQSARIDKLDSDNKKLVCKNLELERKNRDMESELLKVKAEYAMSGLVMDLIDIESQELKDKLAKERAAVKKAKRMDKLKKELSMPMFWKND